MSDVSPPRLLTKPFIAVTAATGAFFVYVGMLVPLLPTFIEDELGAGELGVGLSVSAFALAAICARPLIGRLVDRYRPAGTDDAGSLIAGARRAAVHDRRRPATLLLLRGVAGIGEAALFVGAATLVADLAPPDRRAEAASYFSVAVFTGLGFGPVIGEAILGGDRYAADVRRRRRVHRARRAAVDRRAPCRPAHGRQPRPAGAARAAWHRPLHPPRRARPGPRPRVGHRRLRRRSRRSSPSTPATSGWPAPVGCSPPTASSASSCASPAPGFPSGSAPGARSRIAFVTLAVALAGLAAFPEMWALWAAAVVIGVGMAFMYPSLMALTVNRVDDRERPIAISSFTMFFEIGTVVGGIALGIARPAARQAGGVRRRRRALPRRPLAAAHSGRSCRAARRGRPAPDARVPPRRRRLTPASVSETRSSGAERRRHHGRVLDHDRCYRAVQSRDRRFDGWFVTAVAHHPASTAGRAARRSPRSAEHVEFFPSRRPPSSAATAPASGAGPTPRRARPTGTSAATSSPGRCASSPTASSTGRASRGLASRLSYSERHLTRLLTEELGAGPLAIARAQRAADGPHPHRDDRPRPHGDRLRRRLRQRPSVQRHHPRRVRVDAVGHARPGAALHGPRRPAPSISTSPCASRSPRPTSSPSSPPGPSPASSSGTASSFHRALDLPRGHGVAVLTPSADRRARVSVRLRLADWRDLAAAVARIRRLLDLDADPVAVDDALGADAFTRSARARPSRAARARQRRPLRDRRSGHRRPADLRRRCAHRDRPASSPPPATR